MNKRALYIDLDGVLADFGGAIKKMTGMLPEHMSRKEVDIAIDMGYASNGQLFRDLDLMPDAMELWEFVEGLNPIILTSSGAKKACVTGEKIEWVKEHFPGTLTITVNHSYQKAFYAHERAILIDDRRKSIDPWIEKGGIGVLHTSARDTIEQLTEIWGG